MTIPGLGPSIYSGKLRAFLRQHTYVLLLLVVFLLQAPLWLNPGYFSHDELQWAARAIAPSLSELRFVSWWDVASFQYRPLTFNLWLLLSHLLFETPRLFHVVCVFAGTLNAVLLANVLRRAGVDLGAAFGAALVFGLSPYAVWVHGWVGCLADLIWVGAGLLLVRVLQSLSLDRSGVIIAALAAMLATAVGLLAKEAALAIPALLALATLGLRFPRHWVAATCGSALLALLYIGVRLDVLLHPATDSGYALDLSMIPLRWLQYQVFPWFLNVSEVHVLAIVSGWRWPLAVLLLILMLMTLWRASPRLTGLWLIGSALALGPVLALQAASNQYGYGFIALLCAMMALAWAQMPRNGRRLIGVLAVLTVLHGFQVQTVLWHVGVVQTVFSPSLAASAQAQPEGEIRLWPDDPLHAHIIHRLSHDIPSYAGVRLGKRVIMASTVEQATHRVGKDGSVRQLRGSHP